MAESAKKMTDYQFKVMIIQIMKEAIKKARESQKIPTKL